MWTSAPARYAAAALGVAAATLVTQAVPPLREQSASIAFVAAVIAATWWSGPGPGLAAAGLSALSIDFFFLTPRLAALSNWDDLVRMSAFCGVCVLVTVLDARRRVAEAGLRRSEARFRRLTESRLVGIHVATRSGALVDANDAFLEMVGASREELRAGAIDLGAVSAASSLDDDAIAFLETEARGVSAPYEKEYVRPDGTRVPVLTGSARLDESPHEQIWLTIDLTERKRVERALRESEHRVFQVQKLEAIGRLASGVAHNFNNLLTVVLGHCALLQERAGADPDLRRDVDAIGAAARRAAALTRELLTYARRPAFNPAPVDLGETVSDLCRLVGPALGDRWTVLAIPGDGVGKVFVDAAQLQHAILNLVLNARDAMPDGGTIAIETAAARVDRAWARRLGGVPEGRYVTVSVTDTGEGIAPDDRPHLFEPFFTTKGLAVGTGLGLSTAYGVVTQSGGTIDVVSAPGDGATFTIYLPRLPDEPAS